MEMKNYVKSYMCLAALIVAYFISGCDLLEKVPKTPTTPVPIPMTPTPTMPPVDQSPTASPTPNELIINGDFSNDVAYWTGLDEYMGEADFAVVDDVAKIVINNIGNEPYAVRIFQSNIKLVLGKNYQISIRVKATKAKNIQVVANNDITYFKSDIIKVPANGVFNTYTFTFKNIRVDAKKSYFKIYCGNFNDDTDSTDTILYFDDLSLITLDDNHPMPTPINWIYNGEFSLEGAGWIPSSNVGVAYDYIIENQIVKLMIKDQGTDPWSNFFYQKYIYLEKDRNYRISIKAKADKAKKIQIILYHDPSSTLYWGPQDISIPGDLTFRDYSYDFTVTEDTTTDALISVRFGNVGDVNEEKNVYLDDLKLEMLD